MFEDVQGLLKGLRWSCAEWWLLLRMSTVLVIHSPHLYGEWIIPFRSCKFSESKTICSLWWFFSSFETGDYMVPYHFSSHSLCLPPCGCHEVSQLLPTRAPLRDVLVRAAAGTFGPDCYAPCVLTFMDSLASSGYPSILTLSLTWVFLPVMSGNQRWCSTSYNTQDATQDGELF